MATLIKANKRSGLGTRLARKARVGGLIPGIIYGHGETPLSVTLNKRELQTLLGKRERVLELEIESARQHVLIKEVQYDAMQQNILHLDMARVSLDERVEVTVPIVLRGVPVGALEGGVLGQVMNNVEIECLVVAIPEEIRASVVEMKVGDVLKAKELLLPEGVKLIGDPERIVVTCSTVAEEVEEPVAVVAEGGAEPEVIGAKEGEEGEEGAEGAPAKPEKKEKEKE
jgi:large subunit ribosomal protein L25